ncbi:GAF domain-containing protein [Planosporangium thailandense]|uniref:GAF domain-containing protein n=1 Tax=Planosporangium thailandense TaxID=765197 RepID=A0ABX0Y4I8_9ACTN|nr:GAF domain-containing protein [Planosporangium thailandense]NJC73311.1 GAF domain-containing protein [Planosporangium thailandense]
MGEDARRPSTGSGPGSPQSSDPGALEAGPALERPLRRLAARGEDVRETRGQLLGLLRANLAVSRVRDMDHLLGRVLDCARELVHARYAVIRLVRDDQLVWSAYTGLDDEDAARIGQLAESEEVLCPQADRPRQLRLHDLAHHFGAVGFPHLHPPISSLLRVPVRVRDRLFGNLYLTGKRGADEFTAEDEDVSAALMAEAGIAIDNALAFAEASRRQEWQAALIEITAQLLAGADPEQALRRMVGRAAHASTADGASVTVPTDDPGLLRVAVAEGIFRPWQGETFPMQGSASAIAMAERRPVRLADVRSDPRIRLAGHRLNEVGPAVIAPIASGKGVIGALIVSKSKQSGPFDAADVDMIAAFAGQAALALELAEARRDAERLRLLEDRQRIGEDLQHSVIHRLFGVGLSIQAVAGRVGDSTVKGMITDRVEEIDDIIRDIRATVFALRASGGGD